MSTTLQLMNDIMAAVPFAEGDPIKQTAQSFFQDNFIGRLLGTFMFWAGILIVVVTLFKAIKDIAGGKVGPAVKVVLGGFVLAAVMMAPAAIIDGVTGGIQGLLGKTTTEISKTVEKTQVDK